jgi:hypothetical protein
MLQEEKRRKFALSQKIRPFEGLANILHQCICFTFPEAEPSSMVQGTTNVSTANVIGKVLAEILTSE